MTYIIAQDDPLYDQWDPNWLTLDQATKYTGASNLTLKERAVEGRIIRKGRSRAVRYWRPSLEQMRRAFYRPPRDENLPDMAEATARSELAALKARCETMATWLEKKAHHGFSCVQQGGWGTAGCTCGLSAAIAAGKGSQP